MLPALWLSQRLKRWMRDGAAHRAEPTCGTKDRKPTWTEKKTLSPSNAAPGRKGGAVGVKNLCPAPLGMLHPLRAAGRGRSVSCPWATPALECSRRVMPPLPQVSNKTTEHEDFPFFY